MFSVSRNLLLHTVRAISQFPAESFSLDWQNAGLAISASDLVQRFSVTLPWIDRDSSTNHGIIAECPSLYQKSLVQFLSKISAPTIRVTRDGSQVLFSADPSSYALPTLRVQSFQDAETLPAPPIPVTDQPVCSLRLSHFLSRLQISLRQVDPKAPDPRIRGVCLELNAHTPTTSIREGVCASLPISRVDLRMSATNGESLSVVETPVTWHCLKNLQSFRLVGYESLAWVSFALRSLTRVVGNTTLLTLTFLDDLQGLRLQVDPVSRSDPSFSIEVPWEPAPFIHYLPLLQHRDSANITLPAKTLISACRVLRAIDSEYLRLDDLGDRLGLLAATATEERMDESCQQLRQSVATPLTCLEALPAAPVADLPLLENPAGAGVVPANLARSKPEPSPSYLDRLDIRVSEASIRFTKPGP